MGGAFLWALQRLLSAHRTQPVRVPPISRRVQTPQTGGGSEFVPGELDAVGEGEEGGEFDPDDLFDDNEQRPVVEESAGEGAEGLECSSGSEGMQ